MKQSAKIYISIICMCICICAIIMFALYYDNISSQLMKFFITKQLGNRFNNIRASTPRNGVLRYYNPTNILKEKTYDEYRSEINTLITKACDLSEFGPKSALSDACTRILADGKRLRPIILMEICRSTMKNLNSIIIDPAEAALSIEYMHTASLVIDDMPAFDNDDERRGNPSIHIIYNPATAYMTAISLASASYQNIIKQIDWIREYCPEFTNIDNVGMIICNEISNSMGALGAACGQFMDSVLTEQDLTKTYGTDAMLKMIQLKTATFFEIAFVSGWVIAGGDLRDIDILRGAGTYFGTAYQIADDIGDMKQDAERKLSGKPGWNYANEYGKEAAIEAVYNNMSKCEFMLRSRNIFTPIWDDIFDKVWATSDT
jgi:geranylgeranyl diphosphate synthase type II